MSDGYTKLFSSITDSTIWQENNATRIVWITMLAMADAQGYVGASVPGLAGRARVTLDECIEALAKFHDVDKWSRTEEFDGRRITTVPGGWLLLNHAKYRAIRDAEERREQARLAMAKLRAERKNDVLTPVSKVNNVGHGCPPLAQAEAEAGKEIKTIVFFEEFWKAYPVRPGRVKVGKKPCFTKWKARNLDAIGPHIIANVEWQKKNNQEWIEGYAPNPETYINQDRWADGADLGTTTAGPTAHAVGSSPVKHLTPEEKQAQRIYDLRQMWKMYGAEEARAELAELGVIV